MGGVVKSKDKQFIAKVTAKREFSMLTQGKFDFWKGNIYLILQCYEVVRILLDIPWKLSEDRLLVNLY